MAHSNVSIFIPHAGCPHMCSFCNQRTISGESDVPHAEQVKAVCRKALSEVRDLSNGEIAFFGGSFTAVERSYMLELLEAAQEFLGEGRFSGIRISTRPDNIDEEILDILRRYGVTAIELGAQSMIDEVLEANERGHSSSDVVKASQLIKSYGCFELGLQMMTGLYKSTVEKDLETWKRLAALKPDTMRIYPVAILRDTKLGELFESGEYVPYPFEDAVKLCAQLLGEAEKNGIRIIKLGLHSSETVEEQIVGGYYHPAFRELCEGIVMRGRIKGALAAVMPTEKIRSAEVAVPPRLLSKAIGQKKSNIKYFQQLGVAVRIIPDKNADDVKVIIINQ